MLSAVQCRMEAMASTLASLQDEVAVTQALLSGIVAGKSIHDTFQFNVVKSFYVFYFILN